MADLVNLNRARKAKATALRKQSAAENRALHGRTKSEKARDALVVERFRASVDGARRTPPESSGS